MLKNQLAEVQAEKEQAVSYVVAKEDFPTCLEITAISDEGQVMALRHKQYDIHGIQFHPESVITPNGKEIIKNFMQL